jgi:hypothetical protein
MSLNPLGRLVPGWAGEVLEQAAKKLFWYVRTSRVHKMCLRPAQSSGIAGKRSLRTVERDWQNRRDEVEIQSVHARAFHAYLAFHAPCIVALACCFSILLRPRSWDHLESDNLTGEPSREYKTR